MPLKIIRHRNATRIFHAIRACPGATQREIVEMSNSDKSTVSAVLRIFEERNLITRLERPASGQRGRPSEGYAISQDGGVVAGIHPRPSEIRLVLADLSGAVLGVLSRPMPPSPTELGVAIAAAINGLVISTGRQTTEIRAVGLSVPGLVRNDGYVEQSPNLVWSGFNPKTQLEMETDYPVFIGNNTNGTTLAESLFTRMPDERSFVFLGSGSGVGGGFVVNGQLVAGEEGFAGEFGHMKIQRDGRLCRCGARGCLSAYVSNYSAVSMCEEAGVAISSFQEFVDRVRTHDPAIQAPLDEYLDRLGQGIANITMALGHSDMVLGGGFAELLPHVKDGLDAAIGRYILPPLRKSLRLRAATMSSEERPMGGVAIALEGCTGFGALEVAPWSTRRKSPSRKRTSSAILSKSTT
jgi:predicted NBD/HSP70 family sugar kinase